MEMKKEEFENKFHAALDTLLEGMAVDPTIDVNKFYSMACFLENVAFFCPVLYGVLSESKKKDRDNS